MILQTHPQTNVRYIPTKAGHRTEGVVCGESVYVGLLTDACERKFLRTFINAAPCGDEFVSQKDIPFSALRVLKSALDHLEQLYFRGV